MVGFCGWWGVGKVWSDGCCVVEGAGDEGGGRWCLRKICKVWWYLLGVVGEVWVC